MEIHKKSSKACRWFGWHLISVVFIAFGTSIFILFPGFFHSFLMMNLELRPDSRTYSEWKNPTVPLYMDIYMYNWTNPQDIRNSSTKPHFQQMGPYRFREFPDKKNITFDDTGSTVSYRKFSTYFFDPDGSNGSLSDLCTTVNMIAIGAGSAADYKSVYAQFSVSVLLRTNKHEIHVTKTVKELLFDGYTDSLLKLSNTLSINDTPFDRMGFFVKRNATDELSGNYTVSTGVGDISQLGTIKSFNNLTEFPFYDGECQRLKGSAGEFFSPAPSISEPIHLFTPDMCRSIPYEYEQDDEVQELIGHRYVAESRALDNGTIYDENKCFATDELMPSGVMNVSICNYGQPVFMSFPHFFGADASYLNAVEGLTPEKDKHQSYFTLEPTTGITLEVSARFQTNVLLKQYGKLISLFKNVPRIFMPLFWVEQKFSMDEDNANKIKLALSAPGIAQTTGLVLLIVGIVLMSLSQLRKILCPRRKSTNFLSKIEANANEAVIKDNETNPLMIPMSPTELLQSCCK